MLTVFAERGDNVTLQNLGCFFDDHDRGTQLAKHSDVPELQEPAEEWHEAKLMVVLVNMVVVLKDCELPGSSGSGHSDDGGPAQDFHLLLTLDFLVFGELPLKLTKFPLSSVGKEVGLGSSKEL